MEKRDLFLRRLEKYKKYSEVLRQIHSDKAFSYARRHTILNIFTIVVSALLTFLGFAGIEKLYTTINAWGIQVPRDAFEVGFNFSVFLVLLAAIFNLVFRFQDKANEHYWAINRLTSFIRDIDDLINFPVFSEIDLDKTLQDINNKYRLVTENLPPSTDKEFLRSKKEYAKKKKKSHILDENQNPSETNLIDLFDRQRALFRRIITADEWMLSVIRAVSDIDEPQCWIAGGFVRDRIWDYQHGFKVRTPTDDVDVIFYDNSRIEESYEKEIEQRLKNYIPNIKWSVKNQARMHLITKEQPFTSIDDALEKWPETATAVAIRYHSILGIRLKAPHGLTDLFALIVKPTEYFSKNYMDRYKQRVRLKNWNQIYPKLIIQDSDTQ